jgi:hypothetical protein
MSVASSSLAFELFTRFDTGSPGINLTEAQPYADRISLVSGLLTRSVTSFSRTDDMASDEAFGATLTVVLEIIF